MSRQRRWAKAKWAPHTVHAATLPPPPHAHTPDSRRGEWRKGTSPENKFPKLSSLPDTGQGSLHASPRQSFHQRVTKRGKGSSIMFFINFNLFTKRAVLRSVVKFSLFCGFVFNVLARRAKIRSPASALYALKLQVHYCSDSFCSSFRGGEAWPQACGSTGQRLSLETQARPVSPHGHWHLHHPDLVLKGTHTRSRFRARGASKPPAS